MKKEIFAVYFPSWHPDKHYEQWYGKGFSEWELLKTTRPLFPGHRQPLEPTWGYFDESDPQWMARQIDLAADNGITGFMFDWYWYDGVQFLEKPLDSAFLNAPNRNRLKFFLMWANHNWGVWPAKRNDARTVGMTGTENQSNMPLLTIRHSVEDLRNALDFCCKTYFCQPNYWKIQGRPVYSIYNTATLFKAIPPTEIREIATQVAKDNGFPGIYLTINIGCCEDNDYFCGWGRIPTIRDNGYDSVFAYNSGLRRDYLNFVAKDSPTYDFDFFMKNQRHCWEQIGAQGLPFFPSVTLGSDVSPRWSRDVRYPWDYAKLSYYPICINNTGERIAELLRQALEFDTPAVILNAWNEWSEGMYLLPEKHIGSAWLDAIHATLETCNA